MNSDVAGIWIVIGVALTIIVVMIVGASMAAARAEKERKERIYKKYGHTQIAADMIGKVVWTGETAEQLRDSIGEPLDIDQKVLKTKKKEIWKYDRVGVNRYSTKVILDNDIVVGWDKK